MRAIIVFLGCCLLLGSGCGPDDTPRVVLYCGVDQDQSQSIAKAFEKATGIKVEYHGETEAMRSVGHPQKLLFEKERPRADVYWSNEIMHMVMLGQAGVLDKLPDGVGDSFPEAWSDPKGRYVAFGARARVFLVNTELLPNEEDHPTSVADLLNPKYEKMGLVTCMAEPLTGTTYTHAVALLTANEAKAKTFFEAVATARASGKMKIVGSNGRVMRAVKDGSQRVAFGLTDTDDSWLAIEEGAKVKVIYPDQMPNQPGCAIIPNTVALVRGGPNRANAEKLLRWLISTDTEALLAKSRTAQMPLRQGVAVPEEPRLLWYPDKDFRTMTVDWQGVGSNVDKWRNYLTRLFKPAD